MGQRNSVSVESKQPQFEDSGAAPNTDIFEDGHALYVMMDMPGVRREDVLVTLFRDILSVRGKVDGSSGENGPPIDTDAKASHFTRTFTVSNVIDRGGISAFMKDGVLTLTMPKVPEAQPRLITVQ